ncbi:maleylpyruvate isomerase family mycothiol-dependent enzyme [Micromonospora sp. NBC_01796]|uniref:maleylpyruvate isomerase family mycothiol-dependent enzyme n=1 Tax=Micromonospora sp. NBC_01796 TaxID=2975987 RepID=UPI002DD82588|nr:maleylpyruvate isomerase family mycothiol-dependent enzyme [Micromonospora sp. NBC_01796]WSA87161.1 maleylpyruvate isomerase family mycothiol-dependent enzyme [Micromonospora sp. NBC_01796]
MAETPEFPDLVRLIDERSSAFRAALASAPSLEVQVPTCPEWTLLDLVQHLGKGRRRWAAIVGAGPADAPPPETAAKGPLVGPREREALLAWSAESTEQLLDALRESGPDRGCWTWWGRSMSLQTSGAVARHQLQEVAVHTYDAQLTLGAAQPLPEEVALDGVEDFLLTCCATTAPWPHERAAVDYHATEGRSWRLWLSADGARVARLPTPGTMTATAAGEGPDAVDASLWGTASELVLVFYGRVPVDYLKVDGDRRIFDLLIDWDPDA